MLFHSIRWRLQVWHALILCGVLAAFGFTAYRLQRANELRRVDLELQQWVGPLLNALRGGPPPERGGPEGAERPGGSRPLDGEPEDRRRRGVPREFRGGPGRDGLVDGPTNSFYYVFWSREGRELSRSPGAGVGIPRPERVRGPGHPSMMLVRDGQRELYVFTPPGECLLVGRSMVPELEELRQLAYWLAGLGGGVLVLGLAGGWWLASRAIRPIADISAAAARIAAGDLSHRINSAETVSELGQLAAVLNSTFARLEAAFARQQQFTADASHELRTPVAIVLAQTQATLARDRSPAEYRETLEACQRAAQRMRALTESLLTLARLDGGHRHTTRERLDLGRTVQDCIEHLGPLARERRVVIHSDLAPTECLGDPQQLAQVVANLITNALVHNRCDGEVRVCVRGDPEWATLTVADAGPGISAEDLPRIFERFYRADKSRNAATGGTGLGLAISKAIVEAHGGTLEVASVPGHGCTFTVRLPAGPASSAMASCSAAIRRAIG